MKGSKLFIPIISTGIILSYYIFGYADSVRGAILPDLLTDNGLGLDFGGIVAVLHYGGYCLAVLIFGIIAQRIAKKYYLVIANVISLLGILFYVYGKNAFLVLGLFLLGFSLGLYEFCGNAVIRNVYPVNKRTKYVNIFSSFHSIGAITAPLILGFIIMINGDWSTALLVVVPVILLSVTIFFAIRWKGDNETSVETIHIKEYLLTLSDKTTRKYFAVSFLYIAAEATIIMWLSSYLRIYRGHSDESSVFWLSVFFCCQAVGRFVGGFIIDKFGYSRILYIALFSAAVMILFGVVLPDGLEVLIPLSGIFFSVVFPTIASAISLSSKQREDITMGAFYVFAALGGVFGGFIVSQINSLFGMVFGFICASLMCLAAGVVAIKLLFQNNNAKKG